MTTDLEEQAHQLCKTCGLCCTSFFSKGYVQNDREKNLVREFGGKFFTDTDKYLCFEQPCPAYNGVCSVYPDHPLSCKNYACALLKQLRSNSIDIQSALNVINEMQSTISQIDESLISFLGERRVSVKEYIRMFYKKIEQQNDSVNYKQQYVKALVAYAAYMYLKRKYFD